MINIYKVKMKSINKRGTAWIFVSKLKIDELPVGYQKNQFTP